MAVNGTRTLIEFANGVGEGFVGGVNNPYIHLLNKIAEQSTPVVPVLVDGRFTQVSYRRNGNYYNTTSGNRFGISITFVNQNEPLNIVAIDQAPYDHCYERELWLGGTTLQMLSASEQGGPAEKHFSLNETSQRIASTHIKGHDGYRYVERLPGNSFDQGPLKPSRTIAVGWDEIGNIPYGDDRRFRDYFAGTPATIVGAIANELHFKTRESIREAFDIDFDPAINEALREASRAIYDRFRVSIDNVPVHPPVLSV